MPTIAVIGAGISGLACARELTRHGHSVTVFEKSNVYGGRVATRWQIGHSFDHGAPYLSGHDSVFAKELAEWFRIGLVRRWSSEVQTQSPTQSPIHLPSIEARFTDKKDSRMVGVTGMSAIGMHLAERLDVRRGVRIDQVTRSRRQFRLADEAGCEFGPFQGVVVALPPPPAVALLASSPALMQAAQAVEMLPVWALMVVFAAPIECGWGTLIADHPILSRAFRNNAKPGRERRETWVLHSTPAFAQKTVNDTASSIVEPLLQAFLEQMAVSNETALPRVVSFMPHRWRYAFVNQPLDQLTGHDALIDAKWALTVCGDWVQGGDVQGAFLSGLAAAHRIAARLMAPVEQAEPETIQLAS